jgi:ABC-type Co2+ transport system permease subunit
MLKSVIGIVVFMLELLMLVAFGWYGYNEPTNVWLRIGLAAGLVIAAIILWAVFGSPKSTKRLRLPALAVFRAAMFLVAAFFVYRLGHPTWALVIAVTAVTTQVVSCFTEQ